MRPLEGELGGDLFRRERNLTHLTELGRLVMPMLKECYESAPRRLIGRIANGVEEVPASLGSMRPADRSMTWLTSRLASFRGLLDLLASPEGGNFFAVVAQDQVREQPGPAGLVRRPEPLAGFGVEILVERGEDRANVDRSGTGAGSAWRE